VLVLLCTAFANEPAFSFHDFMQGDWDVFRGIGSLATGEQTIQSSLKGHYILQKENGTLNLFGRYFDNDTNTGETSNEHFVYIEFTTQTAGTFKTGLTEDAVSPLFSFDFVAQPNGVALSHGVWAHDKYYQFQVLFDRFVITLFPKPGSAGKSVPPEAVHKDDALPGPSSHDDVEVELFLGKKILPPAERSFFQKYGVFLMIGAFLFFNNMQRKAQGAVRGATPSAAPRRARAGVVSRQSTSTSSSSSSSSSGSTTSGSVTDDADDSTAASDGPQVEEVDADGNAVDSSAPVSTSTKKTQ